MPKGIVEKIISVTPKPNYKGDKGYVITVLVDQEEVTKWNTDKNYVKVGDTVNYFFDDGWHKPKFNKIGG